MVGLSTEDLTKGSDTVVTGRVETTESYWSADGRTILTRATVLVSEVVKGAPGSERVFVEYEGGEVGDIGLKVSDMAPLVQGETIVLFLKTGSARRAQSVEGHGAGPTYNIVGKAQGKYVVDERGIARKSGFSVAGGEERIENDIPYHELINRIKSIR